jgi:endonuclease/exonuclease/phosphatase family metal-dependent hydrolase/glycosyltransferase involved in cell wall biosynthesis
MRILMVTNTFTPHVGGVARSIEAFISEYRALGHEVMVIAPEFKGRPLDEQRVIRIPSIPNFNGSDFSVRLPVPVDLHARIDPFRPDIVHSHHPFILGNTALRLAHHYKVPIVFTNHTRYEDYTHYVGMDSPLIKRFVIELSTGYANLCDQVFVPSESIEDLLRHRGVATSMEVIPTGIYEKLFEAGDGEKFRRNHRIPADAFVVGHVGRLAKEKNLSFLAEAVLDFVKNHKNAWFLVVGQGPLARDIEEVFKKAGMENRLCLAGILEAGALADAYHAMDVFAFSSKTETQGVVLNEAMAAGIPVTALDAPAVRDVVEDGRNGRLVSEEGPAAFASALRWVSDRDATEYQRLQGEARGMAQRFSIHTTAARALEIYERLIGRGFVFREVKDSLWENALGRIKTEMELAMNLAGSAAQAALATRKEDDPLFPDIHQDSLILKLKRWFSRSEWSAKLLNLSTSQRTETQPGLVMIQIDGFSKKEFQRALDAGRMPFLKTLMEKQRYRLYPYYSGLPSSTPAIQGELFYGVQCAVPSFSFLDPKAKRVLRMYDVDAAIEIEKRLEKEGEGLLRGGSSYSNVYSGGARESHFCAVTLGWSEMWKGVSPLRMCLFVLTHIFALARTCLLIGIELLLSVIDFLKGLCRGEDFVKEFKFILTRASICILLRDLIVMGVRIDIARGLPVIHLNLLGYDEQAHRRGPHSRFARWALYGIDNAVAKIYKAALHSTRRHYDVWIYSDHGQEDVLSYAREHGRSIHEAVAGIVREFGMVTDVPDNLSQRGVQDQRARYLGGWLFKKLLSLIDTSDKVPQQKDVVVAAMGPVGHIYLPRELSREEKDRFAKALVHSARVPMVLIPDGADKARVWNKHGEFSLPDQAKDVIGETHPYLDEVTKDLITLCRHPYGGTFTISGWRTDGKSYSFPVEHGSHAGPGMDETDAFALLPPDIHPLLPGKNLLHTGELRGEALRVLGRSNEAQMRKPAAALAPRDFQKDRTLRIMTYNVHSCAGMDGKISPERIARVIWRHDPDIVALQELDTRRPRTGRMDQPRIIARHLEMTYHFHPSLSIEEEQYGNAILSRYPMRLVRAGRLPGLEHKPHLEPRGVLWVEIQVEGMRVHLLNTHLGLRRRERLNQAQALLGPEWISHPQCRGSVILCGDLNTLPESPAYRHISAALKDAHIEMESRQSRSTWFSHLPVGRIDYIFISPEIEVTRVEVSLTDIDKVASDHLPLIVDIKIK